MIRCRPYYIMARHYCHGQVDVGQHQITSKPKRFLVKNAERAAARSALFAVH